MVLLQRIQDSRLLAQFAACTAAVLVVALGCFVARDLLGHRVIALVLLMMVSLIAMLFRIGPVMVAAALSALVWNYFFIPPTFTFHIGSTEDTLMFMMYFVVASVNAVLSLKIRQIERRARDREEKEKSIKLYNTLLNSLSHELRTPIATIMGAVDTLKERDAILTMEQRDGLLGTMDEAGARLDRQVSNLLHMGRLESGMLAPRVDWCDVNELVARVVNSQGRAGGRRIVRNIDADLPLFKLDGGLLEQVVQNLVHNAVQHTPPETTITIQARDVQHVCSIAVSDDGPGMTEEDAVRVFEKFHRAAGARTGGTGLGLSIVKGFVEAMGGSVGLEHVLPHGSRFIVRIPAETSHLSQLKHE